MPRALRDKVGNIALPTRTIRLLAGMPALASFAYLLYKTAWLSDDAYITFRTIDHFFRHEGLVWNVGERVQAYTHPLWLVILAIGFYFTRELFATTMVISIFASLGTAAVLFLGIARSTLLALFGVVGLALSKAFVDYSTSGLENAASHLIMASYLMLLLRASPNLKWLGLMSFLAALATLARPDAILLYLPSIAHMAWRTRSKRTILALAIGLLPLLVWEGFALIYYGFPFPNTAYAKLNTGIPRDELIVQGLRYLANSVLQDPLTPLIIVAGSVGALMRNRPKLIAAVSGVVLYLGYIVLTGGDFMAGRFLTLPFLVSLGLLVVSLEGARRLNAFVLILVTLVGIASAYPIPFGAEANGRARSELIDDWGISDERAIYYPYTGLLATGGDYEMPVHPWMRQGMQIRFGSDKVVQARTIGFLGYFAGPEVHIIDQFALADPLLARLPANVDSDWRIGHFDRSIPIGYIETLRSGSNKIESQALASYYEELSLIVRGPLFNLHRLRVIWQMNTGAFQPLIETYLDSTYAQITLDQLDEFGTVTGSTQDPQGMIIPRPGVRIDLGAPMHDRVVKIMIGGEVQYAIIFEREGREVERFYLNELGQPGMDIRVIRLPWMAAIRGYDTIIVIPLGAEEFEIWGLAFNR